MDKRVKGLWLEALRGGEFEQTRHTLADDAGYCCLGVLCEVAIKNGVEVDKTDNDGTFSYDGEAELLPPSVINWAGLDDESPRIPMDDDDLEMDYSGYKEIPLAELNDEGKSFRYIAELIETHL